jgi:hypothetical protein
VHELIEQLRTERAAEHTDDEVPAMAAALHAPAKRVPGRGQERPSH